MLDATYDRELPIADHTAGFAVMLDAFEADGPALSENPPTAVGHRVVHGGARFFEPTVITPLVEINIDELSVLAPLHNPANLAGIIAAKKAFPDVPHVAVFDTAFHQTLPRAAYTYAIDAELAASHRIRVRLPRHVPQVRERGCRGLSRQTARRTATDRVPPRQRRVGHRDRRRPLGRDVDGTHAARRTGDGHALG